MSGCVINSKSKYVVGIQIKNNANFYVYPLFLFWFWYHVCFSGSLNCGRLYNQATAMSRFYAKPMLLIEFDQVETRLLPLTVLKWPES